MYSGDFYEKNTLGMENTRSSGIVECRMLFAGFWNRFSSARRRSFVIVFAIVLLVAVMPARVVSQAPPSGTLWVTYVNSTPTTTNTGETLDIVFRVVHYTCDPYLGSIPHPADGVKTATFLLVSVETQQSHEYSDTPVFPTGIAGEYRADIQVVPEDPAGKVWVYVKGMSLNLSVEGGALAGPPINTSSEQTYDTGDLSLIQVGQPPSPSPFEKLFQGNELLLVVLAAIVLLLLAISLLGRRKGKPAK
jgi:hypothetical protein